MRADPLTVILQRLERRTGAPIPEGYKEIPAVYRGMMFTEEVERFVDGPDGVKDVFVRILDGTEKELGNVFIKGVTPYGHSINQEALQHVLKNTDEFPFFKAFLAVGGVLNRSLNLDYRAKFYDAFPESKTDRQALYFNGKSLPAHPAVTSLLNHRLRIKLGEGAVDLDDTNLKKTAGGYAYRLPEILYGFSFTKLMAEQGQSAPKHLVKAWTNCFSVFTLAEKQLRYAEAANAHR